MSTVLSESLFSKTIMEIFGVESGEKPHVFKNNFSV